MQNYICEFSTQIQNVILIKKKQGLTLNVSFQDLTNKYSIRLRFGMTNSINVHFRLKIPLHTAV